MQAICERCYSPIGTEKFIRLGHIVSVRPDGEPLYTWSYLHTYDPTTGGCVSIDAPADAA
ncbi:MAG TPA: hypothetical protein VGH54_16770 [Mycobacterium sp.]|jgi:hypothetical protein|uniref:hypothetical protein n=1 Tax=Mycobacterium sp. TaxID=1785 RepID=UPI002F407925